MESKRHHERTFRHLVSAPFIYAMIIPIVVLDIFVSVYHSVCFRLYKMPLVKRSEYMRLDRHKLSYLSFMEKIHCAYCGYANGLFHYTSRIAADTEKYWCGIKHKKYKGFKEPKHHKDFLIYCDEKEFNEFIKK